jgi:hypothetical protein
MVCHIQLAKAKAIQKWGQHAFGQAFLFNLSVMVAMVK